MAMRGKFLYNGWVPHRGPVQVFQDMDSTTHVFALMRNGQSLYTTRDNVRARKLSNAKTRKANEEARRSIQPTLPGLENV